MRIRLTIKPYLLCYLLLLPCSLSVYQVSIANEVGLGLPPEGRPKTTEGSEALVNIGQTIILPSEKKLGQAWLRAFRRQVPLHSDPATYEFTLNMLYKLAEPLRLGADDLHLVIVKNPQLNAFAVPGGIIGIHTGLYLSASNENQFASVIAHELAHLSQRHYARSVEQQTTRQIGGMAALLAAIVLAASGGGDVGTAALAGTQAALIDNTLTFSRLYEEEADSIGYKILKQSGYNTNGMHAMFEQMQIDSRFASTPPEFLLTHPITSKRIADAKNRALNDPQSPTGKIKSTLDYQLIRARVALEQAKSNRQAISQFTDEIRGFSPSINASRYGLVLALIKDKQYAKAQEILDRLFKEAPQHPLFIIAQSDILLGQEQSAEALKLIDKKLENNNNALFSQSLSMQKAQLFAAIGRYEEAKIELFELSEREPEHIAAWYQLAEMAGKAGDILSLHQARAEFFMLVGNFDSAEEQLNNILKKYPENTVAKRQAKVRLEAVKQLRQDAELL